MLNFIRYTLRRKAGTPDMCVATTEMELVIVGACFWSVNLVSWRDPLQGHATISVVRQTFLVWQVMADPTQASGTRFE